MDQMTHRGRGSDITLQAFFQFTVSLCLPLVLTQVLCPGIHQEYFQIVIGNLRVAIDSPPKGAIATPHATVFMHGFQKLLGPFGNDSIVDRDQDRSLRKISSNFLDDDGHTPMVPRTQIHSRIRKFCKDRDHDCRDRPDPSKDQSGPNRCSLCDRTPNDGPESIASLINQNEDSKDSSSYPIRRQVLDKSVNEGNEDDPRCAAD